MKKEYPAKKEYYGSRDFYHMIKIAMKQLLAKVLSEQNNEIDEHVKESIGINSIERNFAGLELGNTSSLKLINKILKKNIINFIKKSSFKNIYNFTILFQNMIMPLYQR